MSGETAACDNCERVFAPALQTHLLCRVCWFERRGDLDMALAEIAWRKGYDLGRERAAAETLEGTIGAMPLRDLITLCHPDRHPAERFELANDVTSWLNALRGETC